MVIALVTHRLPRPSGDRAAHDLDVVAQLAERAELVDAHVPLVEVAVASAEAEREPAPAHLVEVPGCDRRQPRFAGIGVGDVSADRHPLSRSDHGGCRHEGTATGLDGVHRVHTGGLAFAGQLDEVGHRVLEAKQEAKRGF